MHPDKTDLWLEDKKWNDAVIEIIAEQFEGVNIKWTWPKNKEVSKHFISFANFLRTAIGFVYLRLGTS